MKILKKLSRKSKIFNAKFKKFSHYAFMKLKTQASH